MKRLLSIFILCMVCLSAGAEWKWQNPMEASFPVIQNQGWPDEIGQTYVRLPTGQRRKSGNRFGTSPATLPDWLFIFIATPPK